MYDLHQDCPLRTVPGQIIGWVNGRPVRTIAGGAPDDAGSDGAAGQGDGQDAGAAGANGTDSGQNGQSGTEGAGSGQGDAQGRGTVAAENVADLPDWAQRVIRDARKEAGDSRTAAKTAQDDALKRVTKALGLAQDDDKIDPEKLTQQLADEQAEKRQAKVELAVYRVAGKNGGDPDALLDSRAFLAKVAGFDPASDDFAAQVVTAVKAAVKANPKLGAALAAGSSSADHSGGGGERRTDRPRTLAEGVASYYGT